MATSLKPQPELALPHDMDAEINVLGSMMRSFSLIPAVAQKIRGEDFYRDAHRFIFDAIVALDMAGKPVDLTLIINQLESSGTLEKAGGKSYLMEVIDKVPIPLNAVHYAGIVLDYAMRRTLCREASRIIQNAHDMSTPSMEVLGTAEKEIGECRTRLSSGERIDIMELAKRVADQMEKYKDPAKRGLTTGLVDLDKMIGGIEKQQFIVIGGRASMGKSTLAFNIARKAAEKKQKVLIVTIEMSSDGVLYSMAVSHSHVNSNRIKDGFATEEESQRMMMALGVLVECDLWIEHPKTNDLYSIRALVHEHYRRHGLDLVVIDYLQMMEIRSDDGQPRKRNENRQQEVSTISRSTKMLATELDIPVIGVCQLSRAVEARDGHRPRLSDLRESGSLEQDADVVLLLYRDDYYNRDSATPNICEIDVAKNRSGRTGVIETVFLRDMLLFENKADLPVGDGFAPPSDVRVPD